MDINTERLDFARQAIKELIDRTKTSAIVETTTSRKRALKGADVVLCTILAAPVNIWRHDIEIPKKYGIDINIGDTRGPSGIFRFLRTLPIMLDICRNMERLCPDAILLNYTNPMAMLCRALQRKSGIVVTGLCHSVQETAKMLGGWINTPMDKITYLCAGINHQAWYLEFKKNGKDAYPLISDAVKKKKIYNEEIVRNEMFLHLGYYVTESSGHNSEYNWWFRKRPDLIEKYCLHGTGWNPGAYGYILKQYLSTEKTWKADIKKWFDDGSPMPLKRSLEYASDIINALHGGEDFVFNGNVPNTNLITNLPEDVCVEVPVLVNKSGLNPIHVGALPPQCAALNNISIASEEMAVEAALSGNPELVYHAIAYDPLTAAVLSLAEIKKMVREMFRKNKNHLPQFKTIDI